VLLAARYFFSRRTHSGGRFVGKASNKGEPSSNYCFVLPLNQRHTLADKVAGATIPYPERTIVLRPMNEH
jgi:hypothetical protein